MDNLSLIKNLEILPAFTAFRKGLSEKLNANNVYVRDFMPESNGYYDEKDDDGKQVILTFRFSEEEREGLGIEILLDDNSGEFDDFIHDELRNDVTELMRAIIKECRKCAVC